MRYDTHIQAISEREENTACGHKSAPGQEAGERKEWEKDEETAAGTKEMDRDVEGSDPEGWDHGVISFLQPQPHLSPARPLSVFSPQNLFILGLFLLCELFTHSVMDAEVILQRQRRGNIIF